MNENSKLVKYVVIGAAAGFAVKTIKQFRYKKLQEELHEYDDIIEESTDEK